MAGVILYLGTRFWQATLQWLSLTGEHVDLSHGVDENDGEYCDGKTKQERPRQIPDNTPESNSEEQHENDSNPDEGGEEQQEKNRGSGEHQSLESPQQQSEYERTSQGSREAYIWVFLILSFFVRVAETKCQRIDMTCLLLIHRPSFNCIGKVLVDSVGRLMRQRVPVSLPPKFKSV